MKPHRRSRTCFGNGGGDGGFTEPMVEHRLNALLALDFQRATVRRYLVRRGYAVATFVVFEQSWALTDQPMAAGVEIVRKTGSINKPKGVRA